jgi:transcriptional regulator with XRE-family HTH domain
MLRLKSQLRAHLEHQGISASQLSRKSGVSKQTISYWLNGGSPRHLEQVKQVANALCTSVDELCFGEGVSTERPIRKGDSLDMMFGDGSEWLSGLFEIKMRKIKR